MKKVILSLVIMFFAVPAFARVNISCEGTCGGGNPTPISPVAPVVKEEVASNGGGGFSIYMFSPRQVSPFFVSNKTVYFSLNQFNQCRLEYKDGTVIKGEIGTGQMIKGKTGIANVICQPVQYNNIPKEYGIGYNTFLYNTEWEQDYNFGEVVIK